MPRLVTFAKGVRSRGDGFIKSPSSGMWQCTLPLDPISTRTNEQHTPPPPPRYASSPATTSGGDAGPLKGHKGASESIPLHPHRRPSPVPLQFQLVSTSSRYLCSILITACPDSLSEVLIIQLRNITPATKLPHALGVAFASATEATWADVVAFLRQSSSLSLLPSSCVGNAAESSCTAVVWRLNWVSPAESSINMSATSFWHVAEDLPLHGCVKCTFDASAQQDGGVLHVGVATVRGGAVRTPPNRIVPKTTEPPLLPPKENRKKVSTDGPPQRNLSEAFIEAQEDGNVTEKGTKVVIAAASVHAETALASEKKEDRKLQPTYAEILMRGARPQQREVKSVGKHVREWRRCLIDLREELHRGLCVDGALSIARNQILQHQELQEPNNNNNNNDQQQCHSDCEKVVAALLKVGQNEMLCDVLFDVAASLTLGGHRPRSVKRLLRECVNTVQMASKELCEQRSDSVAALQLPKHILHLRLLRHRCCAMFLLGQTVPPTLPQEAVHVCRRALALLRGKGDLAAVCTDTTTMINTAGGGDSPAAQLVSGVLTAALSLMEISLLVKKSPALRDDMTHDAAALLLWLRESSGGRISVPVALLARLEERDGGKFSDILRRCKVRCAGNQGEVRAGVEFCCGVGRAVSCGAVFDQQFARTEALIKRLETKTTKTTAVLQ